MADHAPRSVPPLQDGCAKGRRAGIGTVCALCALIALVATHAAAQPAAQPVAKDTAGPAQPAEIPETPEGLIKAIQQRETELAQRADDLEKKEERLRILEQDIRAMIDKYVKLRDEVELRAKQNAKQNTPQNQGGHDDRFGQLAKVYEQMAPDDAAARIDKMDETVALKILAAAKPKATAKILTGLPAAKAARLSEQLATGRR
jgi:flagellar motility protein MotE (MotC chaperone)